MLTVDELALLQAIRDSGSLSQAAARLGKAPSTVSHVARQLEERFDALLFDRRRYRMQLTPAGLLLAEEAARLAGDVARLTRRVRLVASGREDRLWIVTDELLEFEALIPAIGAFDALQSGVSLRRWRRPAGRPVLVVPSMRAKILAQCHGLGVGWLPRRRIVGLLARGDLVERATSDQREPNIKQPRLAARLLDGVGQFA